MPLLERCTGTKHLGDLFVDELSEVPAPCPRPPTLPDAPYSPLTVWLGYPSQPGLPPAPQAATQMIEEAHRRTDGMVLADLDTRRLAYVLAGVVVLGASEDEGDAVAPYWFMAADEYEVAWWLRRLAGWLEAEAARPTTVVFADPAVEPIAIALAAHLGLNQALPRPSSDDF